MLILMITLLWGVAMCGSHNIPLQKVDMVFSLWCITFMKSISLTIFLLNTILFTNKFPLPMDGNPPLKKNFRSVCTLNYLAWYCRALIDFQISVNKTIQCQPCNLEQIIQNRNILCLDETDECMHAEMMSNGWKP